MTFKNFGIRSKRPFEFNQRSLSKEGIKLSRITSIRSFSGANASQSASYKQNSKSSKGTTMNTKGITLKISESFEGDTSTKISNCY